MSIFNITDYGAVADGQTVCTQEIQRAIDLCDKYGIVYVPKGTFRTGALFLKSNMTLYLEEGAKLLGSDLLEDFPIMSYRFEGRHQLCYASLINTDDASYENITIEGKGTLDANGRPLYKAALATNIAARGRAICIKNTTNLTLKGITVRESPAWCVHLVYCKNIIIDDISVHTKYDENGEKLHIHNGDGIDIDSCKNVRITNSLIASQDDGIAVKSGMNEWGRRVGIPSENIVIENCRFTSGFGAVMGSDMAGGVKDVWVRNCTFENTFSIASIKAIRGRGNYIKNIHYENCTMINRDPEIKPCEWFRGGLNIDSFYSHVEFDADNPIEVDEGTPVVEDIYFKNITLDTIEGHAIYFCGLPEMHCKNIHLENVKAHGKKGKFIKNIDNLILDNVEITSEE